ncbi:MAG: DUF4384 domain-containing protein [Bryobacteraceae bacterium]
MKLLTSISLALSITVYAADDSANKGAKGLFIDQLSNAKIPTGTASGNGNLQPSKKTGVPSTMKPIASTPKNTGLMYYLELVKPSGEVLRVNSTRAFHSGEKVRLHFTTNMDGRLVIVQKQKNGTSEVLFPDKRVRDGDNRLKAGEDMVVPSERAWFTFDANPGEERLMVFLTTESGYGGLRPMIADATLNGDKTIQLASNIEKQRGSKALKLEVDEASPEPATYVVMNALDRNPGRATSGSMPQGVVATEIVLTHQ